MRPLWRSRALARRSVVARRSNSSSGSSNTAAAATQLFTSRWQAITDLARQLRQAAPAPTASPPGTPTHPHAFVKPPTSALDDVDRLAHETWEMHALAVECADTAVQRDCLDALDQLHDRIAAIEIDTLLSGEFDRTHSCFLQVNAGAGGTESCDWAGMLCAMYTKWGPEKGFRLSPVDEHPNAEAGGAGYRSVTLKVCPV